MTTQIQSRLYLPFSEKGRWNIFAFLLNSVTCSLFFKFFNLKFFYFKIVTVATMGVLQVVQTSFDSMGISPKRKPINHKTLPIIFISASVIHLWTRTGVFKSYLISWNHRIVQDIYYSVYGVTSELGQRFSNAIAEIDGVIGQFNWYLFPGNIQRLLPIVMQSAQEPAVIKCFSKG